MDITHVHTENYTPYYYLLPNYILITTYVLNLTDVKVRKFVLSSKRILAEYHFRIVPPQSQTVAGEVGA